MIAICSSSDGEGRRLAEALARSVLPVPGGPVKRILWRPATAMVSARLALVWPRISSSTICSCLSFCVFLTEKDEVLRAILPFKKSHNSRKLLAGIRSISRASRDACGRLPDGIINCLT